MEQASPKIRALAPFGINQPPGAGADPLRAARAVDLDDTSRASVVAASRAADPTVAGAKFHAETWDGKPGRTTPSFMEPSLQAPLGGLTAADIAATASRVHADALRRRGEARRDAMTAVARAMSRGGARADIWTVHAADTAYNIADMLLTVQGQEPPPLDPAYHDGEADQSARAAAVERAIRAQASPAKTTAPTDEKTGAPADDPSADDLGDEERSARHDA